MSKEVAILASGPSQWARRYTGYIVNGFRFRTKQRERRLNTQNSGVMLDATTESFASAKDKRPVSGDVTYYGVLTDIFELRYSNDFKFVLFKCDWVDTHSGTTKDDFEFTLVNFKHSLYKHNRLSDEPFILASQAKQIWYVRDPIEEDWQVVVKMTPRDLYDMYGKDTYGDDTIDAEVEPYNIQQLDDTLINHDGDITWVRAGVEGTTVDNIVDIDGGDDIRVGIDADFSDEDVYETETCEDDSEADEEANESDINESDENEETSDDYDIESDDYDTDMDEDDN